MKLKIEIDPSGEEEIIIRSKSANETVARLEALITAELQSVHEICLRAAGREFYVPTEAILFFETADDKTAAHIAPDVMLYSDYKLYELDKILPHTFVKVSKSCIVNSAEIESISRNITGPSEIAFKGSASKAYASRLYYRDLTERIRETRLTPKVK